MQRDPFKRVARRVESGMLQSARERRREVSVGQQRPLKREGRCVVISARTVGKDSICTCREDGTPQEFEATFHGGRPSPGSVLWFRTSPAGLTELAGGGAASEAGEGETLPGGSIWYVGWAVNSA